MRSAFQPAIMLCLLSTAALAQVGPGIGAGGYGGGYPGGARGLTPAGVPSKGPEDEDRGGKAEKPAEPPPAIPGAQPDDNAAVIPADKVAADMSPNEALFDAITRGDLAAAKDAVTRGAQLEARNILGQTPLDASIDLDRNDITFLLLSLRGPTGAEPAARLVTATGPAAAGPATTGHAATRRGKSGHIVEARAVPRRPALSQDRGTPNPAAGFIGF